MHQVNKGKQKNEPLSLLIRPAYVDVVAALHSTVQTLSTYSPPSIHHQQSSQWNLNAVTMQDASTGVSNALLQSAVDYAFFAHLCEQNWIRIASQYVKIKEVSKPSKEFSINLVSNQQVSTKQLKCTLNLYDRVNGVQFTPSSIQIAIVFVWCLIPII